jgi:hypothetical protein
MRSIVNAWISDMKDDRREKMSWQVRTEANLDSKKLIPEHMESGVVHREVPIGKTAVKSSETTAKRHGGGGI